MVRGDFDFSSLPELPAYRLVLWLLGVLVLLPDSDVVPGAAPDS